MIVKLTTRWVIRSGLLLLSCGNPFKNFSQSFDTAAFLLTHPENYIKVDSLNEWAFLEMRSTPLRAFEFAETALQIAQRINYKQGIGDSHNRLGYFYMNRNLDSAEAHYLNSLMIRIESQQTDPVASCFNSLALIAKRKGDLIGALDYYEQALEIVPNSSRISTFYKNRSAVYRELGDLSQAYDDLLLAIKSAGNDSTSNSTANSLLQLGTILTHQALYSEAEISFTKALHIFQVNSNQVGEAKAELNLGNTFRFQQRFDEALSHFNKALAHLTTLEDLHAVSGCWNSIGQVQLDLKNYVEAVSAFKKCCQYALDTEDALLLAKGTYNLGCVYLEQGDFKQAISDFLTAEHLADSIGSLELLVDLSEGLSKSYVLISDHQQAAIHFERHLQLRDSVDQDHQELNQLQRLYQREKEKRKEAQAATELKQLEANRRMVIYWTSGAIGLLLGMVGFFWVRNRHQRQQRVIAEKEKLLLESQVDELLSNQELKSISAVLEAQDTERKRIAQDLHDRLGSMLSMVKLHFENVEEEITRLIDQSDKNYTQAKTLLDKATDEVRLIAHNLVSGPLKKFGLEAGLSELCIAVEKASGIDVKLTTLHLEERLSFDFEVNIYRIIQELLANVMKHSKASEVSIQVIRLNGDLSVLVEDNGSGFDPQHPSTQSGMGLKNVRSRVDKLAGSLELDSNKGNGSSISIKVPLKNHEHDSGFIS